ncbi:MAG: bifunctional phosphopantothenoylcysteine decarboxylase/phosphopantothenate--cysteine ligase CoaBC [Pseudomonadota bacterium]|jgi:phosphopantothenoylcysteine decarboxylase/phosphopantothenate--cysteine ligase
MKKILVIITGSVACYKTLDLIRLLRKKNYQVNCILTKSASEFISALLVSSLSSTPTYHHLFALDDEVKMGHIKLARENDLIVIAPASADFIAKIAHGNADDLASCVVLASEKKIILAPAMNEKMWLNEVTQQNLKKLNEFGIEIIEPENDLLACGEVGIGKMANIEKIFDEIENFLAIENLLSGKKILITAGSTREMIDSVRFIGNNSSGKQGIALAKVLKQANAQVTMIAGNINLPIPLESGNIKRVVSAQEMFEVVKENLEGIDVFIGCAAVADFKVKNPSYDKIKKNIIKNLALEFELNPDILEFVGNNPNRPKMVIGFCAESHDLVVNAQDKLIKKNCDLLIANDIEQGKIFGSELTKAVIVEQNLLNKYQNTKTSSNQSNLVLKSDLGKITKNKLALVVLQKIREFLLNSK